ncbi:cytochrome c oxidase subunit 3 family protein [Nocardioides immobilis]|uniref:Cytochrome aa3 subunit 3 n=1 Tax=Nocardioides immobilis TaxID=2049295 RepID=A0A417XZE1_9ACTN|nr:cytochrome c oxidase subunit 3 [Nocardioides immobilis]RHW25739.1 cytochrome c oxidase subunit 3 family protein [Nocardioides immobilis]
MTLQADDVHSREPSIPGQADQPARRIPGEEGLWVFLLGDMGIFALFFGTLVVTRADQPDVFHAGQQALHPWLGIVNTLLLLTGSILVVYGVRAIRGATGSAAGLFTGALVCGLGFAGVKAVEYSLLIREGHTAGTNDFYMYYFVFTGIHLAHLAIGLVLLGLLIRLGSRLPAGRVPSASRVRLVECGGCYWHMVDLLWLVLFPLLYLVR